MIKIIFLDVDGVLNCENSKSRCGSYIGIDNKKVKVLREIVVQTNAKIVLCSSWKDGWDSINKEKQCYHANYFDKKLKRERLFAFDKTSDRGEDRGHGIIKYLCNHPSIEKWCVIDDEIFPDYEECGIMDHLVKTTYYGDGGLHTGHIEDAIRILNGE